MSLTAALNRIGFSAVHFAYTSTVFRYTQTGIAIDYERFLEHDAFVDTPIARIYPALDKAFPGSKFILTIRNVDEWAESFRDQFRRAKLPEFSARLHLDLYGTSTYHEGKCKAAFEEHTRRVERYFAKRPNDLLTLNITRGDGWQKLCGFLNKPEPNSPFPMLFTKHQRREIVKQRLRREWR